MKRTSLLAAFLVAVAVLVPAASAQTVTGSIVGKVADEQGGVLPGVTVSLTGKTGTQTTVTDDTGEFRFVGLPPGNYVVKAELAGFLPQQLPTLDVGLGKTITADFSLKVGGLTESVQVVGTASSVDTKSTATDSTLSQDLLFNSPIYDSTSTDLMNAAPGVNNNSAYGGQGSYGNALLMDGVDTRDPDGGSAWTFFDQNLIEEIQIGGLGAPAEYGGFSGAIVNTVTKSGGNQFSGLFTIRYTNDSLASNNVTDAIAEENPSLAEAEVTTDLTDYTVQLGGPIVRDKLFFFTNFQRYSANIDPTGPRTKNSEISPRFNGKVTWQSSPTNTFLFGVQYDQYNIEGRNGYPGSQSSDSQTVTEDAPEWVWNVQWRKVFGSNTFLEAKFTGYDGYYYLDPVDPSPVEYDAFLDAYYGGGGNQYYADRGRNQLNVSLSQYAKAYGNHAFKFGAEIERATVRSQYQPYGPSSTYIYLYDGVPYFQYNYGYDMEGQNRRFSAFAQDQWSIKRLTLNLGIRLDNIGGRSPVLDETVYTPRTAWGPRLGAAFDLTGNGTSVLRAFWGRYFEGAVFSAYQAAVPGLEPRIERDYLSDGSLDDPFVVTPGFVYGIADDMDHPRTDEFNVSWEQQITSTLRFTASGIWRTWGNYIGNIIEGARWRPVTLPNALTGGTLTGYKWINSATTAENFVVLNPAGYQYIAEDGSVIGTLDPERKYQGMILSLNRSFSNRWSFNGSYVLSKTEGNSSNADLGQFMGGYPVGSSQYWNSPNTSLINTYGELYNSRRHEIKLYGTYQVPKIEVLVAGIYTGLSGRPYTPYQQYSSSQLGLPGSTRRRIFLEPRGSEVNDFYNNFDLRVEKVFKIGVYRLGFLMDAFNLFNISSVTTRQTRVPTSSIGGYDVEYGAPTAVQAGRQIYFAGRLSF